MKSQLLTLEKLSGIHFVDKGAAQLAKVLVVKRDQTDEEKPMPIDEKVAEKIAKAVLLVLKEDGMGAKSPQQLLEESLSDLQEDKKAAIMAAVTALHQAPPPAPAPGVAPAPAAAPEAEAAKEDIPKPEDKPKPVEPEKADDKEGEMKPDVEKALAKLDGDAKAFVKSLMGEVEKLRKSLDEASEKNGKLEDRVAKREAEIEMEQEIAVAKQFPYAPGDVKKRAALLLGIKKNQGPEAYDEMIKTLKSANEMAKKGLKGDGGTSLESRDDDDANAADKLDELAKQMVTKGDATTYEQAYERVCKANRELYNRAERERVASLQ